MSDIFIKVWSVIIFIISLYVSGWLLFLEPIIGLFGNDVITGSMIAVVIIKIIFSATVCRIIGYLGLKIGIKIALAIEKKK